jgi:glutaryl-CoA dehydrogenase
MDDFFHLDALLSDEEKLARGNIRHFVDKEITPHIAEHFEKATFPDVISKLASLDVLGMSLPPELGGSSASAVISGLVCQELERGDSGLRSFISVQNALCIYPIFRFGSPWQHQRFLKKMTTGELIGCFGLTEPNAGSDPSSMSTCAKKVSGGYLLSGSKTWITNAPFAHLAIVWAKTDEGVRGFIVERDFKGFSAAEIKQKLSMRASLTGELHFDQCFVPDEYLLPKTTKGLACALSCLNEARFGIAWGAMGAAMACYEIALNYAKERIQFNKPIASHQLIQKDLVDMLQAIIKGQLLNIHLGRLKDNNQADFNHISLAKMSNTHEALKIARLARSILGANGISLEFHIIRHMANLETLVTYEGTDNIHHLIVGKHITGVSAF